MGSKKAGGVDDLNLVRFPWQLIYVRVFSTEFCYKRLKMAILRHVYNFAPLPPPHFEDNWILLTFHLFLIYRSWIGKNLAGFGSV